MKTIRLQVAVPATIVLIGAGWLLANRPSPPATSGGETPIADSSGQAVEATDSVSKAEPSPSPAPAAVSEADPDSIEGVLAALGSSDKTTRTAAIERAKNFEDRSVVPSLQAAAERLGDAGEKAALLAAIDFINLPSVAEVQEEQKANLSALGLSPPAQPLTNRYTGRLFRNANGVQTTRVPPTQTSN